MGVRRMPAVFLGGCLAVAACLCLGAGVEDPNRPLLDKLLKAFTTADFDAYVADGNDAFKAGSNKEAFAGVSRIVAPRLRLGYEVSHLGVLRQQGCQVHLYKLACRDGGDDILVRLVLLNGQLAGFWFQ